jgi:hypothetical protein
MWTRIVWDRPADHFSPCNLALLEQYCAVHITTRRLWQKLRDLGPLDPEFGTVLEFALAEVETSMRLAGCLGLLPPGGEYEAEDDPEAA